MEEKVSFANHKVIKYIIRDVMILMLMALCGILGGFVPSLLCKVISLFMVSFSSFMKWKGGRLKWVIISLFQPFSPIIGIISLSLPCYPLPTQVHRLCNLAGL